MMQDVDSEEAEGISTFIGYGENEDLAQEYKAEYWLIVRSVLSNIFCASDYVLSRAEKLQNEINGLASDERNLFYHAEPLDVACDLARAEIHPELTAVQKRLYLELRREYLYFRGGKDHPSDEDLERLPAEY
jgi:hypothetical protein